MDYFLKITTFGVRNLQYVLSHNTKLSCLLQECGISFNIEKRTMSIGNTIYNIDFDYYCNCRIKSSFDEKLKSVAHRVFYDFCVDGFMYNDYIESYGTDIHKRPEFIRTLIDLSDEAQKLDAYWKAKSKPYKVVFYATAEQIHKFTFGELNRNSLPYTEYEQNVIMKIMTEITDDAETVKYRGDVFDDFLRFPKLRDSLAQLLEELNDLRDISRFQKDTEASSLWKLINRLREIDGYVNCITKIKECLESRRDCLP